MASGRVVIGPVRFGEPAVAYLFRLQKHVRSTEDACVPRPSKLSFLRQSPSIGMKAMPYADAVTILEALASDVAANPQPDFARVLGWWEKAEAVTILLEGRVPRVAIEYDALLRLRGAIAGAATRAACGDAVIDPSTIRAPALALHALLRRLERLEAA
jgi:hypothetical protein